MKELFYKTYKVIKFNLFNPIKFLIAEIKYNRKKGNFQIINVLSDEETINKIKTHKLSISRFGDGELKWILNVPQGSFQTDSESLSKRLKEVLNSDSENLLICIPDVFADLTKFSKNSKRFWRIYMDDYREEWTSFLDFRKEYGDSLITRPYMGHKDKKNAGARFRNLKSVWEDKNITIIEGSKSYLGLGNDLFSNVKSITRIIAPTINAYDKYDDILEAARKVNKDNLVLIALGPTATILAYDLNKIGYQALDVGHIDIEYEWYINNASKKSIVKGKYVNETWDKWIESVDSYEHNVEYKASIINVIE